MKPPRHLDNLVVGNGGKLLHNDNSATNVNSLGFTGGFIHALLIADPNIGSDAGILIDNSVTDIGVSTNTERHTTRRQKGSHFILRLIIIGTHNQSILNSAPFADIRTHTNDGVLDSAFAKVTALGDNGIGNLTILHGCGGENARGRVNRTRRIVKLEGSGVLAELEIFLKKTLNGTNIFPISIKWISDDVAVLSSRRNNFTTKVIGLGELLKK
mmetsp:Transcript_34464/g.62106  ORF Transcript_34464/g.62106 Transcript_34464/m.62106 type:complete len:214 (+) Transcript_34464:938-1579(+)